MKIIKQRSNVPWMLIAVFLILITCIIITGGHYYVKKDKEIKAEVQKNLAAIADLKIGQITQWRNEREGDALMIQNSSAIARLVKNHRETKGQAAELTRWIEAVCTHNGYASAAIYDATGETIFSYGKDNELSPTAHKRREAVMKRQRYGMSDIHISSVTNKAAIGLLIPLILWDQKDHPTIGVLFFRIDPYRILYPLIQSWPTPSPTSETLLVRREGGEIVFLNELRHRKGAAFALRLPITREDLPAALAARGVEGMVEGVDYRGVPVLAAIRKVADTSWFMIAKVDKTEVYAPLHHELLLVAFVMALLVIATGAILGLWWRHQRAAFYRRQYEAEIERQALLKHFDYVMKYANDMILLLDIQGNILEVNDQACRSYGYQREELLRMHIRDLRPPESRAEVANLWKRIGQQEGIIYETEHVRIDGTRFPIEVSARGFTIEGKKYFQAIIRDITKRKQAELALSGERERLAVTLRSIGDAVITTDIQGTITLLNRVAEDLTGWSSNEAVGLPLAEILHIINERTRERCENPVDKVLKEGTIVGLANNTVLISRDGREMIIADSGAPIRDWESKTIGVVLVFRDITDKRRTEHALQNAEKLEAVGLLAGGIAHDFNNLLGGIFGYLELAQVGSARGDVRGVENALSRAAGVYERAKNLTQQLLIFSKGGAPIRKTQSLAEHVQRSVSFALSGSNVSPVFTIPAEVWPCDFDENQMAQVFDNLVINARQAMPLGGKLDIAIRNVLPADAPKELPVQAYVCVSIRDYGSGIAKEHLPRIFDPFFTTKQEGSGLGLATSYSIVKKHDGLIAIESELGKGTTFHVYLPASPGQVLVADEKKKIGHRGHGRILVMDDEGFILEIASQMLKDMGYEVVTAENGDQAIAYAKSALESGQPFRMAILDLTVPGGRGGQKTVHALLEIDPDIKVVASSGYSEDPVMSQPADYGFVGRLIKPYRRTDLILLLESLLK